MTGDRDAATGGAAPAMEGRFKRELVALIPHLRAFARTLTGDQASADVLRVIVGLYFLFRGISLLSYSHFRGRSWPLILGGAITALFGLFIIFNAVFGAITIIVFTAIAFIIMGVFNVWLGLHARPR